MGSPAEIGLSFLAGVASFLSPCIVPMVTVYLSLITGLTVEELRESKDLSAIRARLFKRTVLFVIGFSLVFTIIGGMAGLVGAFLARYQRLLEVIGGTFILIMGLRMLGLIKIALPGLSSKLRRPALAQSNAGAFGVGLFYAVACSHCIGPLLYSVLIYAGMKGSVTVGMATMLSFSVGLGTAYLVLSLAVGGLLDYLAGIKDNLWVVSAASGLVMVVVGVIIVSGNFAALSNWAGRLMPFELPGGM